MPPRWPRKPDRENDPAYRKLDDRITFAVHVAGFGASNSILWFWENLTQRGDVWAPWFSLGWLAILAGHFAYVSIIADYSEPADSATE
ncbi:MAG: 2TM domain-containing protein [Cyanobacteria bacterium P01_C01_bin.89]